MPSLDAFVKNVTGFHGLAEPLRAAARADIGRDAPPDVIESHASQLLLEALLHVGINPRTERVQRQRLSSLLRGDLASDIDVQKSVDYILSQMVIQPKGALAERLAISCCVEHIGLLASSGRLPTNTLLMRNCWSPRLVLGRDGSIAFAEWRESADGIFYTVPSLGMQTVSSEPASRRPLTHDDLLLFGVAEVKCYRESKRSLADQMDKHLARLAGGLQVRSVDGGRIERQWRAENLWYAVLTPEGIRVTQASERHFRLERRETKSGTLRVRWNDASLDDLVRFSVGPRPARAGMPRVRSYDRDLALSEAELEELGAEMAYYTLGVLADQPDVDLPGVEWSSNLRNALRCPPFALSTRALVRRDKILSRL